ncbi:MAG TPA: rhodanese-like domain-containing protein [Gammaproteobacteria bacterium]|jgi:rhodanese-related sulfurtransferase
MDQLAEFAGNHVLLVLGLLGSFALAVGYELRLKASGLTQVSAGEAVKLINRSAIVLDMRSPEAYRSGHIVNAKNISLAELQADPDQLNKKKNKLLLTVCETGAQAGKAANLLRRAGFENTFSLRGGIRGWQSESLPLVK